MSDIGSIGGQGFVVIGVNRSGTSALAAALQELGVFYGKPEDLPSKGRRLDYDSHENNHIVNIGATILAELEKGGLPARKLPENWRDYPDLTEHVAETASFLASYFKEKPLWGWKDPLTSILIPFFEASFERVGAKPKYLMTIRHPLEMAEGIYKRQGLPIIEGIGSWIHYTLTALSEADLDRLVLVPFHEFTKDPQAILTPLLPLVGLPVPSESDWARVRSAVRPELDRARASDEDLPEFARRVWDFIRPLAASGRIVPGSADQEKLLSLAAEWNGWMDLTRMSQTYFCMVQWRIGTGAPASTTFPGDREWHDCVIEIPPGVIGNIDIRFTPPQETIYLRKPHFETSGEDLLAKPASRPGAFLDVAPDGDARVMVYGDTEHLSFPIPAGRHVQRLRFQLHFETSKRSATLLAARLATELRSQKSAPVTGPVTFRFGK